MFTCLVIIFLDTFVIYFWQVGYANAKSGEQPESRNHLTCEYSRKQPVLTGGRSDI
jgi:hypothetical protein